MEKMTYFESLKDPRWREKRKIILRRDKNVCTKCGKSGVILEVHHTHYKNGLMAWEYEDKDLTSLCNQCHEDLTNNVRLAHQVCVSMINSNEKEKSFMFLLEMIDDMDMDYFDALCRVAYKFRYEHQNWKVPHPKKFIEKEDN